MKVRFLKGGNARETHLSNALEVGIKKHGDTLEVIDKGGDITLDCDVVAFCGVKSREIYQAYTRASIRVVYFDKGYSRHSRTDDVRGWEYWRWAVNSHQPTCKFRPDYPSDRLALLAAAGHGWEFKPWRKKGNHVVIAGSSQKYHDFYQLKPPADYYQKLSKYLNGYTDRQIVYRPKPSFKDAAPILGAGYSMKESISTALEGAHCLVTHGSNACFEAMLAGVPSIIIGEAVAKPISSVSIKEIESPRLASDEERSAWLRWLSYQQFTENEMKSGLAWEVIRDQLIG